MPSERSERPPLRPPPLRSQSGDSIGIDPGNLLEDLTHIGVDELSFRKHHAYVTVVIDHVRERVVWVHPGKSAETLTTFFKELGPERCRKLQSVTMDMSPAYLKAVTAAAPEAQVIFDRFHVQRMAHDALDEVRRAEVRERKATEEGRALKHTRFLLHKNPWNLTVMENQKLAAMQRVNQPIYRAYLLKETLAGILDIRSTKVRGQFTASAREVGKTRWQDAAEWRPDPVGEETWTTLTGYSKSRKVTGPSGSKVWVRARNSTIRCAISANPLPIGERLEHARAGDDPMK